MSMEVRPGYVNPLTTRSFNKLNSGLNRLSGGEEGGPDHVKELQTRQQQLQSQLLIMKATGTDGGGASADQVKNMEEKLDETKVELRSAKADRQLSLQKPRLDRYEKEREMEETGTYKFGKLLGR